MTKLLPLVALLFAVPQDAAVETKAVEYKHGDVVLQGHLAWRKDLPGKRPAVIVVHEWKGLGDYAKRRAEQLAKLGYVAFAIDMYGKGVFAKDHDEAGKLAGMFFGDRKLMRERAIAGLEVLKKQENVDPAKIAAIGYCFGGSTVLELARANADVVAVVSFHGALKTPKPEETKAPKARILVCHGADDKFIPAADVAAFQEEMRKAGADWQFVSYGGAVHSFTVPEAGNDPSKGAAYNEKADKRSWDLAVGFLAESLK